MDGNGDDPFGSLTKLCIVSDSQEDILRSCSFAGGPKSIHASPFTASHVLHLHPTNVPTASPLESLKQREQATSRDSYHPPPEKSAGKRPMDVDEPSLQNSAAVVEGGCVSNVATGVDLGKKTDLGFLEIQSTQQSSAEIEITGVRRSKVSESDADGEAESASKRLKLSNEALDKDSSVPVGEKSGKVDDRKVSNGEENIQHEEPSCLNGSNSKETNDATSSRMKPTSIIMEILKILSKEEDSEEDKKLANMSILEVVMSRGMTFPRPCWWPEEGYDSGGFNKKS